MAARRRKKDASGQLVSTRGVLRPAKLHAKQEAGDELRIHDIHVGNATAQDSNGQQKQDLKQADSLLAPNLAPESEMDITPAEQAAASEPASTDTDKTRLAVIADLLADLPDAGSREVIAELPPADRAAIARLLIGRNRQGGAE